MSPSLTASPFGNIGALTGTINTRTFNGSYTGNTPSANPQTIPFLPKIIVFFKGVADALVVWVDITVNPPTIIAVLTRAPTFLQFSGTTGITATSFDPNALDTLTSLNKFNLVAAYNYWILG